jgi:GTP pyrophosphokinase
MTEQTGATTGWRRLAEATAYALKIHAAQTRKGTQIPYIAHLMAVAGLVLEHGGDEDQAIAALLHDAIEDCGADCEPVILERFGPRVAAIVRACTDADTPEKPEWLPRKQAHLRHLEARPEDVLLVACCDKLHNARAILTDLRTHGNELFGRFNATREQTLWYYQSVAEIFARRLPGPLSREMSLTVAQIHELAGPKPESAV